MTESYNVHIYAKAFYDFLIADHSRIIEITQNLTWIKKNHKNLSKYVTFMNPPPHKKKKLFFNENFELYSM